MNPCENECLNIEILSNIDFTIILDNMPSVEISGNEDNMGYTYLNDFE